MKLSTIMTVMMSVVAANGENLVEGGDFAAAANNLAPICRAEEGRASLFTEDLTWNKCGKCEVTRDAPDNEHAGKMVHAANVLIGMGKDQKGGFPVQPGMRYDISFDVRGGENVKGVGCGIVCWTGPDYWRDRKNVKVDIVGGSVKASSEWSSAKGTFTAPPGARSAALRLSLWSSSQWPETHQYKVGDYFLFDNVKVETSRKNLLTAEAAAEMPVVLRKTIALGESFSDLVSLKDGRTPASAKLTARWRKDEGALYCDVAVEEPGEYVVGTPDKPWSGDTVELQIERPDGSYKRTHVAFNNAGAKYTDAGEGRGNGDWEVRVKGGEKSWQASVKLPFAFLGITGKETELGFNVGHARAKVKTFDAWATGRDFQDPTGYGRMLFTSYADELKREFGGAVSNVNNRAAFEREWIAAERKRTAEKFARFKEATFSVAPVSTIADWTQPFMPAEVFDPPRSIVLKAAVNEIRALPLAIANFTARTEDYRVILETCDKGEHIGDWGLLGFPADHVIARKGMRYKDVDTDDPSTRFDPLPQMDEAGTLTVPPREAGLVWYDFDCRGVKPGTYQGRLRVIPTCEPGKYGDKGVYTGKMQTIPVTLEVVNAEISTHPSARAQYYMDILTEDDLDLAHQIGTEELQVHSWNFRFERTPDKGLDLSRPQPTFTNAQQRVRDRVEWGRKRGIRIRFFVVYAGFKACGGLYGCDFTKKHDLFVRIWPQYVRGVKMLMNGAGVPDEDYTIEVDDEPSAKFAPNLVEIHRLAKEACPTVRLAETLACWKPELKDLKAIAPYCDRWILWRGAYFNNDEYHDFVKSQLKAGKEVSLYSCDVNLRLSPLQYYREHPWVAERHGLTGADMYQLTDNVGGGGLGYKDFKSIPYGGLFYRSFKRPIPSLRFMAMREGFTDCKFMAALRAKNAKANDPEVAKFLSEAAIELMDRHPNDATLPDRLRDKARELLAK